MKGIGIALALDAFGRVLTANRSGGWPGTERASFEKPIGKVRTFKVGDNDIGSE